MSDGDEKGERADQPRQSRRSSSRTASAAARRTPSAVEITSPAGPRVEWVLPRSIAPKGEKPLPQRQEDARRRLQWFLMVAIGAEIIWTFLAASVQHLDFNIIKDVLALTFTPLVVLLTAITNFYSRTN